MSTDNGPEHGWTRHGHSCCDQAPAETRPSIVARCGGPGLCGECSADMVIRHAPRTGRFTSSDDIADAEARGYQRAITDLRARYEESDGLFLGYLSAAAYLEAKGHQP